MYILGVSVCGESPDLEFFGTGLFHWQGDVKVADCDFYSTYFGTITLRCEHNGTWTLHSNCTKYGECTCSSIRVLFIKAPFRI